MSESNSTPGKLVQRWNDFDPLEEVVLGIADNSCFPPWEPAYHSKFNDPEFSRMLFWPTGRKKPEWIDKCNEELNGFRDVLEGEGVIVKRPDAIDYLTPVTTPDFSMPNHYCGVCPRDVMMTIGNEIIEAPMSKRHRYFEFRAYRSLAKNYFDNDPNCLWTAAPKPLLADSSYNLDFWKWMPGKGLKQDDYLINENEMLFDAADTLLIGKDLFVLYSKTANNEGYKWLERHLRNSQGIRCHQLHFPSDLLAMHIDCNLVTVRPGLCLTNPDRPPVIEEMNIFKANDWELKEAPYPMSNEIPLFCQSSRWLAMNVFSISPTKIVVEETEKRMQNFLDDLGFDVLTVPYRHVYEFGGSVHCSTWDIRRQGGMKDYFPHEF